MLSAKAFQSPNATPYLYTEQEEVEVEVHARQNVFVRHRHQNGGAAVCKNSSDRILRDRVASISVHAGGARQRRWRAELFARGHLNPVVVALFIVGHREVGRSPLRVALCGGMPQRMYQWSRSKDR